MEQKSKKFTNKNYNKNYNKNKSHLPKTTMNHLRGLPPSPHWANKFSSIIIDDNLFYLTNNFIVNIDLTKKEFYQLINTNMNGNIINEKLNIICEINENFFICVTNYSNFFIYQKYYNTLNLEDKRVYFRQIDNLKFDEINYIKENKNENFKFNFMFKTIKNINDYNILMISDNFGNLHLLKYSFKNNNNEIPEFKYLNTLNYNNYVTDSIYIKELEVIILSNSKGEILLYKLENQNLRKINLNEIPNFICKEIYSLDYIKLYKDKFLISGIDKNGTLFIIKLSNINKDDISTQLDLIYLNKNKFNNKLIEEKFLFFTVKFIPNNSSIFLNEIKLIITSNKGKIFLTNFNIENQSEKIELNFREVTDNPHYMSIFNILQFNNKFIFISSDNIISFFKLPEILFEFDIKTIGSLPKFLSYSNTSNSNRKFIFLLNESNLIQYNFTKKLNGLSSTIRMNFNNEIINFKQSYFNEFIFAFLLDNFSVVIYNYLSDVKINKLNFGRTEIVDLIFVKCDRRYKDDLKIVENVNNNNFTNFKQERIINTINQMFSENKEYDLIYILDKNGIVTIWDFIYNKINKIKINSNFSTNTTNNNNINNIYVKNSLIFQLKLGEDILAILLLNNKGELSFNILIHQIINFEIFKIKKSEILFDEFICDYFIVENDLFLFFIDNSTNLKLFHFYDLLNKIYFKNFNYYEDYVNYLKNIYLDQILPEIILMNISYVSIKNIKVYKNIINDDKCVINFMISQSDNIIKIFDLEYFENKIYKIILKYSINSHLNKIINTNWINQITIASISNDHTLKIWNTEMCKLINLIVGIKEINVQNKNSNENFNQPENSESDKIILSTNNINKLNSLCLYQQSFKISDEFTNNFIKFYINLNNNKNEEENFNSIFTNSNPEFLIFSLFKNPNLNFQLGEKIINYEIKNITESKNITKFIPNLINLILYSKCFKVKIIEEKMLNIIINKLNTNLTENKEKLIINNEDIIILIEDIIINKEDLILDNLNNFKEIININYLKIILEKNYIKAIEILINNNLHIEGFLIYKLAKLNDYKIFINILEKLRTFIYTKQTFQSLKVQKVIECLENYFK